MAAVTAPGARKSRKSLIGMVVAALEARSRARGRPSRLAAAVSDNVMTFAGLAAVDFAFFHLGTVAGWSALGVSLFLADFKMRG